MIPGAALAPGENRASVVRQGSLYAADLPARNRADGPLYYTAVMDQAQGRMLFGAYARGERGGEAMANGAEKSVGLPAVIFVGLQSGIAQVTVMAGQAASPAGQIHAVEGQGTAKVEIHGEQSFLPVIQGH